MESGVLKGLQKPQTDRAGIQSSVSGLSSGLSVQSCGFMVLGFSFSRITMGFRAKDILYMEGIRVLPSS